VDREGATEFTRRVRNAVQERGASAVALAGGTTPRGLYERLAAGGGAPGPDPVPWDRVHLFWGDERHVPPEHPESNYRMALDSLLSKVPVPSANIHRIRAEEPDARRAAAEYERELRAFFRLGTDQTPRFDLVLLGMGVDGHTASLFPGSEALRETSRLVAAPVIEKQGSRRITLTPRVFNNSACVMFLVTGSAKAGTLRDVLEGEHEPDRLPAQIIRPLQGDLLWIVDRAAGRLLASCPPAA
jgi:6-phosphogluconolactonase